MKNLRVTGITLKQDSKIYISNLCPLSCPVLDLNFLKPYAEHSGKKVPIKEMDYKTDRLDRYEIIISGNIAKKLGVTVGDKINIKVRLFGKPEDSYLTLYEKQPKKFIKYFNQQSLNDKKNILKELLEQDFVNEEVISYLDKHESKLIREVGLE